MNKFFRKTLAFFTIILAAVFSFSIVFADTIAHTFSSQNATSQGSNGSTISVNNDLQYVNKGNNSSIVGNYFQGYYFDDMLGYFSVDSLPNPNENVRVIGSTDQCVTGYGYKLGGYSYSSAFGFMDFDYNDSIFVYYCISTETLQGYGYSETSGFQDFSGIGFPIETSSDAEASAVTTNTGFLNDGSEINDDDSQPDEGDPDTSVTPNSNFTPTTIQNDKIKFQVDRESLFYIIK